MAELTANEIGMQELTMSEVDDVSGGILCLLVLAFAGGYALGTAIYKAL
jgi:hypothetical protein